MENAREFVPIGLQNLNLSVKALRLVLTFLNVIKGDESCACYCKLEKKEQCVEIGISFCFISYYITKVVIDKNKFEDFSNGILEEISSQKECRLLDSYEFDAEKEQLKVKVSYDTYKMYQQSKSLSFIESRCYTVSSAYALRFAMILAEIKDEYSLTLDEWKSLFGVMYKYRSNNSFIMLVFKVAQQELKEKNEYTFQYEVSKSSDYLRKIKSIKINKIKSE